MTRERFLQILEGAVTFAKAELEEARKRVITLTHSWTGAKELEEAKALVEYNEGVVRDCEARLAEASANPNDYPH
jgi:hypothetical protein